MVSVTRILKSRSTLGNEEFVNREIALKRKHDRSQRVMYQLLCHIVALPFTLKSILRQMKNYGKSNISPCKNVIFKKSSKRN
jgi:hypothetical protein